MNRHLLLIFVAVLIVKAVFFALDPQPAFFFGDSAAYLSTAISNTIPFDRSFTYGLFLRPLVDGHSLIPLLVVQCLLSAIASWAVAFCLLRYFNARVWLAASCALLCAIEPLQLMSERFIMTETVSTFAFAVCIASAFEYLKRGGIAALIGSEIAGVAAMSFRYSFLPVVLALAVVLPLLTNNARAFWVQRWKELGWRSGTRAVLIPLVISVIFSQALLFGYRHWYGKLAHEPPSYLSRDGDFLVADVAPIVKPQDFPLADKRHAVFDHLTAPLNDPLLRRNQRWVSGGLCDSIIRSVGGNEDEANRLAKKTALRAMKRDPLGLLKLAAYTYGEFFHRDRIEWALELNQGQFVEPVPPDVLFIRKMFGIDTTRRRFDSLTKRWEQASVPWCWLLVVLPFVYLIFLASKWRKVEPTEFVCLLVLWIILVEGVIPTEFANPRYLTAEAWLAWIVLGSMVPSRKLHL